MVSNGRYFFRGQTGTTQQLWVSDGTFAGTIPLKPMAIGQQTLMSFVNFIDGYTYFGVVPSFEIWRTNGTPAGTEMFNAHPDVLSGQVRLFPTIVNGKMIYHKHTSSGYEFWITNGTLPGTTLIKTIPTGANPGPATPAGIIYE